MFEDEASYWLDGTTCRTWAKKGCQPQVDSFGQRKTAHVFGAVSLAKKPVFEHMFAKVFNGETFLLFLKQLVHGKRRKIFLVIDNGPCHNLRPEGKEWLRNNVDRIELFRLPPYSPNLNPIEGVWKVSKKKTTHNQCFKNVEERDAALKKTYALFNSQPDLLAGHVAKYL